MKYLGGGSFLRIVHLRVRQTAQKVEALGATTMPIRTSWHQIEVGSRVGV